MKKILLLLLFIASLSNAQIVNIPDVNFKTKLLEANSTNGYAQNFSGNFMVIDANSDGQIQNSEALAVKTLTINYFNISDLTGIEAFSNLEELSCIQNQISFLNVSSLTNLKFLRCSNNTISSLNLNGLTQLETLECHSNQMSTINLNSAVNLKFLVCYNNLLSNLDFSQNILLEFINASTNQLSAFNLNGLNNLKDLCINVNQIANLDLTVIDSLESLQCDNNQLTSLNLSTLVNLNTLFCSGNQLTSLDISNQNLYALGCANNLLTTLDLSNSPNLGQLSFGNPGLNSVDLSGCTNLNSINFYGGIQTTIDISNSPLLVNAVFINTDLTTIDISNSPLISNFYLNNNNNLTSINIKNGGNVSSGVHYCPNLQYVCANESDITNFNNALANGMNNNPETVVNTYCSFTPNGNYNTITGSILFDSNSNGCGTEDLPWSNLKVNISSGTNQGATFTNNSGDYIFYTEEGSFNLTPNVENPTWFTFTPSAASVFFENDNNNITTQDFCITANGVHPDVEVVITPIIPARPGFDATYQIIYRNKGNQALSGTLQFTYEDDVLDYVSATQLPDVQTLGNLTWNYNNLLPFEVRTVTVVLNVNSPMETPAVNIEDQLNFTATINPISGDETPLDNVFGLQQIVVGSYDPNDKTCLEGNVVSISKIGDYLHYNINFENTGTFPATFVVVKDMIDATKFDVSTLQVMNASHPLETRVAGNKVEFIFDDINLGPNQHGNVVFKIKTKATLVEGNTVTNNANIYFDYNFPIETNTTSTTFQTLSNGEFPTDYSVLIAPNPTKNYININCNNTIKSVELFDVQGRVLMTQLENHSQSTVDVSNCTNGIYFVKVTTDKGSRVEKIIKD